MTTTINLWPRRLALTSISLLGTAAYAASFALCDSHRTLAPLAAAVGVAAAVAWALFMLLARCTVRTRAIEPWIDLCLRTQAVGMAVLVAAAIVNATFFARADWLGSKPLFPVFIVVHAGLLLVADALMGAHFVAESESLGLTWPRALAAWVLGLNGVFAAVLALLVIGRTLT